MHPIIAEIAKIAKCNAKAAFAIHGRLSEEGFDFSAATKAAFRSAVLAAATIKAPVKAAPPATRREPTAEQIAAFRTANPQMNIGLVIVKLREIYA